MPPPHSAITDGIISTFCNTDVQNDTTSVAPFIVIIAGDLISSHQDSFSSHIRPPFPCTAPPSYPPLRRSIMPWQFPAMIPTHTHCCLPTPRPLHTTTIPPYTHALFKCRPRQTRPNDQDPTARSCPPRQRPLRHPSLRHDHRLEETRYLLPNHHSRDVAVGHFPPRACRRQDCRHLQWDDTHGQVSGGNSGCTRDNR